MTPGIDTANQWWRARNARERGLLLLLAFIVFGFAAWYGIASPLSRAAERSEMHRTRAAALLREVENSRASIARMAIPTDASLDDVLTLSAAEAGFALENHSEENARETTVQGHAPEPAALFGWIEMLLRNHGLIVTNLTTAREQDGALRVEAVLVRGGS
jgi:type II secretory pathway component PulM